MFKLVGYKKVSYTRSDGTTVNGYRVFGEIPDSTVVGSAVCSFWINRLPEDLEIGLNYDIIPKFDRDGKMSCGGIVLAGDFS